MRGRHLTWGRSYPPEPDATNERQRLLIAQVKLSDVIGYARGIQVVSKGDVAIGYVRATYGGQFFKRRLEDEWLWAGHEWSANDPPFCLAILCLLEE